MTDPAACGPVCLSLPQDVQTHAFDCPLEFLEPRVLHFRRPGPDARELATAAALLKNAKKPLIVAGGGVALIRTIPAIEAVKGANDDEQIGVDIIKRAVEGPLRSLAANAGVEGSLIVQEVKKRKGNEGYNVATGEYEDLVKAGVVDPKKVTRSALQNAASIAGLLLTTECLITDAPEKEKAAPMGGGHGGGGGMGDMGGMGGY
jgi:chaperonin GroEL (HSP60 family)